jgi:endonuclease III
MTNPPKFSILIKALQKFYGAPKAPRITDPLEMILWENVAYLVDDERRAAAFAALKKNIGTKPQQILKATDDELVAVTRIGGMVPEVRAQRLRQIAELAHWIFKDDLKSVVRKPLPEARKALKKFPSVGDPGAEKILMMTRSHPVLSLESNGLRVLLRIGFAEEKKSYSASYRAVQQALQEQLPASFDALIAAYQLLRQHGQELCKRSQPLCGQCPVRVECSYFQGTNAVAEGAGAV